MNTSASNQNSFYQPEETLVKDQKSSAPHAEKNQTSSSKQKPKKGHPWRCHSEPARKMNQKGYIPHRSMMGLKV